MFAIDVLNQILTLLSREWWLFNLKTVNNKPKEIHQG